MRIVTSPAAMQRLARQWQGQKLRVGFVPTMGCLHDGHLSLVHRARKIVGPRGRVVLSLYVNPTQFGPTEDLARYPRPFDHDKKLCRAAGVDVLFAPAELYGAGEDAPFSTYVVEETLSRGMEGVSRPTHFRGVTTVVAKLFNLVLPDVAIFGEKDFQQAAVIRRMVRDLNFPLRIVVAPIKREADGLAMSSRNRYLSPGERAQATVLSLAIAQARQLARKSLTPLPARQLKAVLARLIKSRPAARIDYLEFFNPDTLQPVDPVRPGAQLALAVFIGRTRLIDNARL